MKSPDCFKEWDRLQASAFESQTAHLIVFTSLQRDHTCLISFLSSGKSQSHGGDGWSLSLGHRLPFIPKNRSSPITGSLLCTPVSWPPTVVLSMSHTRAPMPSSAQSPPLLRALETQSACCPVSLQLLVQNASVQCVPY